MGICKVCMCMIVVLMTAVSTGIGLLKIQGFYEDALDVLNSFSNSLEANTREIDAHLRQHYITLERLCTTDEYMTEIDACRNAAKAIEESKDSALKNTLLEHSHVVRRVLTFYRTLVQSWDTFIVAAPAIATTFAAIFTVCACCCCCKYRSVHATTATAARKPEEREVFRATHTHSAIADSSEAEKDKALAEWFMGKCSKDGDDNQTNEHKRRREPHEPHPALEIAQYNTYLM